jgi:BirA family biotin operon repressor/biotin-[acetyl-CoA-carboxylase] ligase
MIADGAIKDRTIILAAAQSAGRGRGAHRWVSHQGNLYASFVYAASERRPTLSYAFAVAVAEALLSFNVPAQIKWPNDILADGKKIAGLLPAYCRGVLVVGVGMNVKSCPPPEAVKDSTYKAAKVASFARDVSVESMLNAIVRNFDAWRGVDFSVVRARWMELSIDLNSEITYRGKPALYCGLSECGAMLMLRGDKYELVYGDEIFT